MFTSACGGAWVGRVWVGVGVGERGEQHPPWEPLRYSGSGSGPADAFGFQLFHNRNIKAAAGDAGQLQLELCRLFYFYPAAPATPSPVPPPRPPQAAGWMWGRPEGSLARAPPTPSSHPPVYLFDSSVMKSKRRCLLSGFGWVSGGKVGVSLPAGQVTHRGRVRPLKLPCPLVTADLCSLSCSDGAGSCFTHHLCSNQADQH